MPAPLIGHCRFTDSLVSFKGQGMGIGSADPGALHALPPHKPDEASSSDAQQHWFRLPKGHERRIHGRRHAGGRIVQKGATLALVLHAHCGHTDPFAATDLCPCRHAKPLPYEQAALRRRKVMRKARSKKKRCLLLVELENPYLDAL
jgi:hypothetical protein